MYTSIETVMAVPSKLGHGKHGMYKVKLWQIKECRPSVVLCQHYQKVEQVVVERLYEFGEF